MMTRSDGAQQLGAVRQCCGAHEVRRVMGAAGVAEMDRRTAACAAGDHHERVASAAAALDGHAIAMSTITSAASRAGGGDSRSVRAGSTGASRRQLQGLALAGSEEKPREARGKQGRRMSRDITEGESESDSSVAWVRDVANPSGGTWYFESGVDAARRRGETETDRRAAGR